MSEENQFTGDLLVAVYRATALVRIEGRGSYQNAGALRQFGEVARRKGAKFMVLDGKACEGMDSTFLGTIVGLASDFGDIGGSVSVTQISNRLRKTFCTLGMDRVVDMRENSELPASVLAQIDSIE